MCCTWLVGWWLLKLLFQKVVVGLPMFLVRSALNLDRESRHSVRTAELADWQFESRAALAAERMDAESTCAAAAAKELSLLE